ncbi:MAG: DUF6468 domain-containing protein [Caulobacterales bacterium]
MNFTVVLEIFLAILLVACLLYCWRVEKSLAQFRASRTELESSARELVIAVSKAEGAIKSLRVASQEAGQQLQEQIQEARALTDELQLMGSGLTPRAPRTPPPSSRAAAPDAPMWNR